jgi:hypothetical protein
MVFGDVGTALHVAAGLPAVLGQLQLARRRQGGFVAWIAADILFTYSATATGRWWYVALGSIGVVACAWEIRSWSDAEPRRMRRLFVDKRTAG